MSNELTDLKVKLARLDIDIKALQDQMRPLQVARNDTCLEIAKLESKFKVGDRVLHYKKPYEISSIKIRFGAPRLFGRLILKSGQLGVKEFEIYSESSLSRLP